MMKICLLKNCPQDGFQCYPPLSTPYPTPYSTPLGPGDIHLLQAALPACWHLLPTVSHGVRQWDLGCLGSDPGLTSFCLLFPLAAWLTIQSLSVPICQTKVTLKTYVMRLLYCKLGRRIPKPAVARATALMHAKLLPVVSNSLQTYYGL